MITLLRIPAFLLVVALLLALAVPMVLLLLMIVLCEALLEVILRFCRWMLELVRPKPLEFTKAEPDVS